MRGVEMDSGDPAVEIARSVHQIQVAVRVEQGLNGIGSRPNPAQAVDREDRCSIVEDDLGTGCEIIDVTTKDGRRGQAGLTDRLSRLGGIGLSENDE